MRIHPAFNFLFWIVSRARCIPVRLHMCASWTSSNISNHFQLSYSSRMSSSLTEYVDYATLPTGTPSKLPALVKNLEIEKYLTDFRASSTSILCATQAIWMEFL